MSAPGIMQSASSNLATQHGNQLSGLTCAPQQLRKLVETVLNRHHLFLKKELPALETIIFNVRSGASEIYRAKAAALLPLFTRFHRELAGHMKREEMVLFPMIEKLETAVLQKQAAPKHSFGPLSNAIVFMNEDHDFGDKLLGMMAETAGGYELLPNMPEEYRSLMQRMRFLTEDMKEHVHLEDNVLFPQAVLLEESKM